MIKIGYKAGFIRANSYKINSIYALSHDISYAL